MAANKKKKGKIVAAVIILIILAILIGGFAFVKGKLNLIDYDDGKKEYATIQEGDEDQLDLDLLGLEQVDPQGIPSGEIYKDKNVINVLLLGTDERTKDFSDNARSDSMMLLSINTKEHTAKLVSLERGMGVPILEGPYKGQYDWLTHCFRYGGADLVMKEVRECFRVDVEHFVRVNFTSVEYIVDLLGGIDVNLTAKEAEYFNQCGRSATVGVNHFDGETALFYARIREIDSDWQRVKRQQTVIQACADKLKGSSVSTLNELLNQILPMVQTNFTQGEITKLMLEAPEFLGVEFERMTLPEHGTYGGMIGMGGRSMFAPDFAENAKILREFLYS